MVLRYDLKWHFPEVLGFCATAAIAATSQVLLGTASGLYRGRWRMASFEGIGALARYCAMIAGGLLVLNLVDSHLVPESVPLIGGAATFLLMLGGRCVMRIAVEHNRRPNGEACEGLLILGAGHAAEEAIATMLRSPDSPYIPLALLDDDSSKRHFSIMGVPVVGNRHDMAVAAERFGVETLLIAVRSGDGTLNRELADLATEAGLNVKVLPSLREVIEGTARPTDIRKPTMQDLLGRREIQTDLAAAASYLTGRRVLVTGAGGSIGSEL
ncbi:MAG: polysaccharide biosynthesis protein, partial [Acidimicrobiales bacterium]